MLYACLMYYTDDRELLHRVRPSHRAFLAGLLKRGSCVAAGSFVPADDGGLFLYEAPDLAAAEAILAQDPYVKHGVAARHDLHEWETHGVRPELLRVTGPARKGP